MITFTVKYPYKKDRHFDMEYYCNIHLDIAKKYFGNKCKGYIVLEGSKEINEGKDPEFACIAHLFFNSVEDFNKVMKLAESDLTADIKNYTNIEPEFEYFAVSMQE
jgi:uncharacterized protein (TIGR02118 family)